MQCASSHTSANARVCIVSNTRRRNPALANRSGAINNRSIWSAAMRSSMSAHESMLDELIVTADRPSRSAAATWSRISASSGDTTIVGPHPRSRSMRVAEKYTADLPNPVRATSSVRRRSATTAATASI